MVLRNHYFELNLMYGHEECQDGFMLLKSGRSVDSTYNWTPLVFGLIHGHQALLDLLVEKQHLIDLRTNLDLFQTFDLEDRDEYAQEKRAPREGFHNLLTMVVENDSKNSLATLLDSLYYLFDMKTILHLVGAIRDLNYSS